MDSTSTDDEHQVDPVLSGTCDYLDRLQQGEIAPNLPDETWDLFYGSHMLATTLKSIGETWAVPYRTWSER